MASSLYLKNAPPFDAAWLAYNAANPPRAPNPDIYLDKKDYLAFCRDLNSAVLAGSEAHLTKNISISDVTFRIANSERLYTYRQYVPTERATISKVQSKDEAETSIIYYHGGGLIKGDLDSEDLTCRRICLSLSRVVYSCEYRLMPNNTPDDALSDALALFNHLVAEKDGPFVLVGSSSGGQLAAQVSQDWLRKKKIASASGKTDADIGEILGVLLRGPVTCNASEAGIYLPARFRDLHTSLTPGYLIEGMGGSVVDAEHRTTAKLPLEAEKGELVGMPKHWFQLCTNDIYYSDGACYVEALKEDGVDVRVDVLWAWGHTFWLKAPQLDRAVKAEEDMLNGLRWLLGLDKEEAVA